MAVEREVHVDASPEEVWEALATEEGREDWLEEPLREIHVEHQDAPHRLVWWWAGGRGAGHARRVPDRGPPTGTRVLVTESMPSFPLAELAARFALVLA